MLNRWSQLQSTMETAVRGGCRAWGLPYVGTAVPSGDCRAWGLPCVGTAVCAACQEAPLCDCGVPWGILPSSGL